MADKVKDKELGKVLRGIEKQLKSIHGVLTGLETRIETLEGTMGHNIQRENPLIYSKVLMGTLHAIEEFEIEKGVKIIYKGKGCPEFVEMEKRLNARFV